MNDNYEKGTTIGGLHKIESQNILCDSETGRVIAVFYNDYDLEVLLEILINPNKEDR